MEKLLTRDQFRNSVFERDGKKCVICNQPAIDAHHILERRLFISPEQFGGYFLSNGASVCEQHHREAEMTILSCDTLREKIGITKIILPDHLYDDNSYDKWGNIDLPNGNRVKGELFYDESVQKILEKGGVLDLFIKHVKYPRTWHLPWSTLLKDDRQLKDDSCFVGKEVIMLEKLDGENTTFYNDHIHARSLDSQSHESRDRVKGIWSQISYLLDDNMRICGENMYAIHTVKYDDLKSYFYMFSMWEENTCLSWDETLEYAGILGLEVVPTIYRGVYDAELIKKTFVEYDKSKNGNVEGFVLRTIDSFTYGDFRKGTAKYVKPSFRQAINNSHGHWISKKIEVNQLEK